MVHFGCTLGNTAAGTSCLEHTSRTRSATLFGRAMWQQSRTMLHWQGIETVKCHSGAEKTLRRSAACPTRTEACTTKRCTVVARVCPMRSTRPTACACTRCTQLTHSRRFRLGCPFHVPLVVRLAAGGPFILPFAAISAHTVLAQNAGRRPSNFLQAIVAAADRRPLSRWQGRQPTYLPGAQQQWLHGQLANCSHRS